MPKFRKKPVEIEAWRWEGGWSTARPIIDWIGKNACWACDGKAAEDDPGEIEIETLEGTMTAQPGDWIIKGVKGEFYPCKPDIFIATYDPV